MKKSYMRFIIFGVVFIIYFVSPNIGDFEDSSITFLVIFVAFIGLRILTTVLKDKSRKNHYKNDDYNSNEHYHNHTEQKELVTCDYCGTKNDPDLLQCTNCNALLK